MDNIPSKEQIQTALDNAYAFAKTVQGGKNASYIPALAQVPSDLLAIAAVTVNGDVLTAGSADRPFAIESISKAFNLAYVMDLIGMKQLRTKIGADPTGDRSTPSWPLNCMAASRSIRWSMREPWLPSAWSTARTPMKSGQT